MTIPKITPRGQIKDTCCDYQSIEDIQTDAFQKIQDLVKTKFFRYYRADLWKECPFWNEAALCTNRDCSVATTDETLLPVDWRKDALSAVQLSPAGSLFQPFQQCTYKDQDFCLVDDQLESDSVVYIDLTENPERFTGYAGPSSGRVWKSIYEENCFNIVHQMTEGCETCNTMLQKTSPIESFPDVPKDKKGLTRLLNDLAETADGEGDEICLEKRVYYRLISGLHSSISIHICDEWFDRETGVWGPNLNCFVNRIGAHPERLQNVYFTYALLLRAIKKFGPFLEEYDFRTGDLLEDNKIKGMVRNLIDSTDSCPSTFDEHLMFKGPKAHALKTEFRDHFRNVSKIMDCVGCEKCRLWGKLQTVGLGTALKVLFSYEDNSLNFKANPLLFERSEIVALFNTFNRLSESLHAIQKFRELYVEDQKTPELMYPSVFKTIVHYSRIGLSRVLNELERRSIPVPVFIKSFV
ncbi:endoplasmic reticulum oxidoreductin 1 [Backusella circina FSU 941]|nr:endoplasmic reticulum oxidoreductin 1 [Backusella circina FSU 941]